MLAGDMAMRLRKNSWKFLEVLAGFSIPARHSLNEFSVAHDHAAR